MNDLNEKSATFGSELCVEYEIALLLPNPDREFWKVFADDVICPIADILASARALRESIIDCRPALVASVSCCAKF